MDDRDGEAMATDAALSPFPRQPQPSTCSLSRRSIHHLKAPRDRYTKHRTRASRTTAGMAFRQCVDDVGRKTLEGPERQCSERLLSEYCRTVAATLAWCWTHLVTCYNETCPHACPSSGLSAACSLPGGNRCTVQSIQALHIQ